MSVGAVVLSVSASDNCTGSSLGLITHARPLHRHWRDWVIVVAAALDGAWMLFDGVHALVVGDYVTPRSGPHAGQLGPWSKVVSWLGIKPRSTRMKATFVAFGLAFLATSAAFAVGRDWAARALMVLAASTLWYLPVGSSISLLLLVLLCY
jgi:hypothetical protein